MNAKKAASQQAPTKVCIHVVKHARDDVRTMRAAEALTEAGFAVTVVDIESDPARPDEELLQGVCFKHLRVTNEFATTRFRKRTIFRSAQILIRSIRRLLSTKADIYHANNEVALPACTIVAWLRRKPLVFEAYELPLNYTSIRWRWLLLLFTGVLKFVLPHCAGVISVSPPIAQVISERYHPKAVTLVRNILPYQHVEKSDRLRQEIGLSPQTRVALYQGAFQRDRGLPNLIHAARFLEPGIVIVMMGEHREGVYEPLVELVAREGVGDRVKLLPPAPYHELLTWTASADLGLIIFDPAFNLKIKMCLPNKLFEYLMAGLPILASELVAITPILQAHDVGHVISSLEPEQVGIAINEMLADQSALDRMRRNALQAAQELCWEKEKYRLINLYKQIQSEHQ